MFRTFAEQIAQHANSLAFQLGGLKRARTKGGIRLHPGGLRIERIPSGEDTNQGHRIGNTATERAATGIVFLGS